MASAVSERKEPFAPSGQDSPRTIALLQKQFPNFHEGLIKQGSAGDLYVKCSEIFKKMTGLKLYASQKNKTWEVAFLTYKSDLLSGIGQHAIALDIDVDLLGRDPAKLDLKSEEEPTRLS